MWAPAGTKCPDNAFNPDKNGTSCFACACSRSPVTAVSAVNAVSVLTVSCVHVLVLAAPAGKPGEFMGPNSLCQVRAVCMHNRPLSPTRSLSPLRPCAIN